MIFTIDPIKGVQTVKTIGDIVPEIGNEKWTYDPMARYFNLSISHLAVTHIQNIVKVEYI